MFTRYRDFLNCNKLHVQLRAQMFIIAPRLKYRHTCTWNGGACFCLYSSTMQNTSGHNRDTGRHLGLLRTICMHVFKCIILICGFTLAMNAYERLFFLAHDYNYAHNEG